MGLKKIFDILSKSSKSIDELINDYPYFKPLWVLLLVQNKRLPDYKKSIIITKAIINGVNPERLYEQLCFKEDLQRRDGHQELSSDDKLRLSISSKLKSEIEYSDSKKNLDDILEPSTEAIANPVFNKFEKFNRQEDLFIIDPQRKILKKDDFDKEIEEFNKNERRESPLLDFDFSDNENENSGEKKEDIIDRFLKQKDVRIPKTQQDPKNKVENEDLSEPSVEKNDGILSETLAQIYVKQEKFGLAINVYEQLSLKYPEKSVYFAEIISDLKKR
jgi:hypothetical protein